MAGQGVEALDRVSRVPVSEAVRRRARRIVGDPYYRDSLPDKLAYGRDCWPMGILWTRGGKLRRHLPDFIVAPGSVAEVVALIELARESGTPIIPYGAGSGVCGGTLALRGGFTLDVKRLSATQPVHADRLTVRAGAGAIGMHLESDLNRRGYTMGHYPSSLYCSCLGGYLAGRSAGQTSSRYGKIEDMCLSLEMVAGTGEVIESSRWHPDPTRLFLGSEGTLGVITAATMRVEPLPCERVYRGFKFGDEVAALEAIRRMIQAGFRPAVVRLYDAFDSLIAGSSHDEDEGTSRDGPALVSQLGRFVAERALSPVKARLRRAGEALLRRAVGAPLMLNRVSGALPTGCLLIVGFEGEADATRAEAEAAFADLQRSGEDLGEGPGRHWYDHRFAISYKQSPTMDMGLFVDTMEVSTTWENLHTLYVAVRRAVGRHAFVMAHFSHVYPEGSSIYFTFAGFGPDQESIESVYQATWRAGLSAVRGAAASITHHHGVGISKAHHLEADHHGGRPLSERIKARFDPDAIMNPNKLWDVPQVNGGPT